MPKHRSQPLCIDDAARQITEFIADPCELVPQPRRYLGQRGDGELLLLSEGLTHYAEIISHRRQGQST